MVGQLGCFLWFCCCKYHSEEHLCFWVCSQPECFPGCILPSGIVAEGMQTPRTSWCLLSGCPGGCCRRTGQWKDPSCPHLHLLPTPSVTVDRCPHFVDIVSSLGRHARFQIAFLFIVMSLHFSPLVDRSADLFAYLPAQVDPGLAPDWSYSNH